MWIEKINIQNNIDLKDLSPEYKKLFDENIKFLNLWKEKIFKKSQDKIIWLDDDLNWIKYLVEKINPEDFKKYCFKELNLA